MRGHENPALDVARATAQKLGLPLVLASFLLYSHTFPTLRRFKYMLEGLQDTQQELRAQVSTPCQLFAIRNLSESLCMLLLKLHVTWHVPHASADSQLIPPMK